MFEMNELNANTDCKNRRQKVIFARLVYMRTCQMDNEYL